MKLASRVSLFLLAGLTVMLVVNSVLLYAGARFYLYLRFEDQLESALHTLVAAVEVEEDDVKWEPSDHTVTLGAGRDVDDIRWVVADESGRIVDHSRNLLTRAAAAALVELSRQDLNRRPRQSDWQISQQSLAAPHPKHPAERSPLEHARLHIVVARSWAPLQRTLSWLILGLIVVPALGWLVIALGGRWLCLHAIAPVTAMAENIRRFQANDACARLDVPATRDELQDLGGAFNELLDRLFVAIDRQRRFAGDAAHQLRTPLTVLQGQVEVALRRRRSADEYESTLHVIAAEVASLRQTIETLLFLARSSDEATPPDRQRIDLPGWLDSYWAHWKTDARWPDIRSHAEAGLTCDASPSLLAQLLDILISNALKYSQSGSLVEVRAAKLDNRLQLEVVDRGIGIAPDDLEAIFDPFFRTRQARHSGEPGTGLGLAIARRLAKALGSELRCESQLGAGSRFWLTLPHADCDNRLPAEIVRTK